MIKNFKRLLLTLSCIWLLFPLNVSALTSLNSPTQNTQPESPTIDAGRLRAVLTQVGVDPDSPQGETLTQFILAAYSDPAWRSFFYGPKDRPLRERPFDKELNADERMTALHLMQSTVIADPKDCLALTHLSDNGMSGLVSVSPQALKGMFDLLNFFIHHDASRSESVEHYSVSERMEAYARLNTSLKSFDQSAAASSPEQGCVAFQKTLESLEALPEPYRSEASWELFHTLANKPSVIDTILTAPDAYLDSAFDESLLPETVRRSLPANGSRKLPFKRFVVDGEWVTNGSTAVRFKTTLVNRTNNGVLAEQTVSFDDKSKSHWAYFRLSYRLAELSSIAVSHANNPPVARLDGDTAIKAVEQPFVSGVILNIPEPQPSYRGEQSLQCRVGESKPASTIYPSLTGVAVDLHCSQTIQSGFKVKFDDVWLEDYQVDLTRTSWDEDGTTQFVIDHIYIEPAASGDSAPSEDATTPS